jgi:hypothetical protein
MFVWVRRLRPGSLTFCGRGLWGGFLYVSPWLSLGRWSLRVSVQ